MEKSYPTYFASIFVMFLGLGIFISPPIAKAGVLDSIINAFKFTKNGAGSVSQSSEARNGVISPEVEQQLKDTGRWDDLQALLADCGTDTKCQNDLLHYYTSFNAVSNPNSSFQQAVGNAVDLNSSAEDLGTTGVDQPLPQEISQPPAWIGILNMAQEIIGGATSLFTNHNGKNDKTGANISSAVNQLSQYSQQPVNPPPVQQASPQKTLPASKIIKNWQLVSGNSSDTCTTPTYLGEAQVSGWYENAPAPLGSYVPLHLTDDSAKLLPLYDLGQNSDVILINVSPEFEQKLKQASKDTPAVIDLKGYRLYCEGSPQVSQAPFPITQQQTSTSQQSVNPNPTIVNEPSASQPQACTPNWQCSGWSYCFNNEQSRICNDSNYCGVTTGKPAITQSCTPTP